MLAGLLAMSSTAVSLSAQDYIAPAVEISKEKIKIDGKIFLSHVVKEKQTLYSISKAYGVSIEDLYQYNSKLREEGLKKNSILLIPFMEQKPVEEAAVMAINVQDETGSKAVKPMQTAEPEKQVKKKRTKKAGDKVKVHVVKWYEDIKSIANKYSVKIEDIMEANQLKDMKVTTRQKLIIPDPTTVAENAAMEEKSSTGNVPVQKEQEKVKTASLFPGSGNLQNVAEDSTLTDTPMKKDRQPLFFFPKTSMKMTMLLPLQANEGKSSRNFMDFYSGALLALKHMKEEGINTNLQIHDTSNEHLEDLAHEINRSDLIIGPVQADQLKSLYAMKANDIPVVSPLDPRTEALVDSCENFIFAPTSHNKQYEDLCRWVKEEYQPENRVIVIFEKNGYKSNHHPIVLSNLQALGIPYREFSYSILEGRGIQKSLEALMNPNSTNRVIIASESEAFVNDVVRNINLLTFNKLDIVLYASGKIRSFETIAPEYLHNTRLHASMSYNIDYKNEKVMTFLKEYRALYNTEPTQFAFQGYDVTKYFVEMYTKYGNWWMDCITQETVPMLQSSFKFTRNGVNGYVNTATRRVIYEKDFVIKDLNEETTKIENKKEGLFDRFFD